VNTYTSRIHWFLCSTWIVDRTHKYRCYRWRCRPDTLMTTCRSSLCLGFLKQETLDNSIRWLCRLLQHSSNVRIVSQLTLRLNYLVLPYFIG